MTSALKIPTPQPIDDLEGWLRAFVQPTVLVELAVLIACVAMWMVCCFRWCCCALAL